MTVSLSELAQDVDGFLDQAYWTSLLDNGWYNVLFSMAGACSRKAAPPCRRLQLQAKIMLKQVDIMAGQAVW